MGKITVTMWLTLDGFAAGPNGELDWILGDDEMARYELDAIVSRDALLFGGKTYRDFSAYWPNVQDSATAADWEKEYGKRITPQRKYVISNTLTETEAEWDNTVIIKELSADRIKQLKGESENGILIYGSLNLVQQLANLDLIDRYELLVHPIALGEGKALFANLDDRLNLTLKSSRQLSSGVLINVLTPRQQT